MCVCVWGVCSGGDATQPRLDVPRIPQNEALKLELESDSENSRSFLATVMLTDALTNRKSLSSNEDDSILNNSKSLRFFLR